MDPDLSGPVSVALYAELEEETVPFAREVVQRRRRITGMSAQVGVRHTATLVRRGRALKATTRVIVYYAFKQARARCTKPGSS
jgi:hypothetical protein